MPSRTIRIDLEYDGTDFRGFVPQPAARTIGGELEAALTRLLKEPIRVSPGGRTDSGVHARGQVVSFQTTSEKPAAGLKRPLNAVLGDDMWVREVSEAPPDFDARRSAQSRRYGYAIWNAPHRHLWERRWMYHVEDPLNIDAMQEATQMLVGRHDFASFRTHQSQDMPGRGTVRRVLAAEWRRDPQDPARISFDIEADAFLRHMVRTIVGSAVQIGRGKLPVARMQTMLEAGARAAAGPTAPAHGLTLLGIRY